jgi:hypothetical protein
MLRWLYWLYWLFFAMVTAIDSSVPLDVPLNDPRHVWRQRPLQLVANGSNAGLDREMEAIVGRPIHASFFAVRA